MSFMNYQDLINISEGISDDLSFDIKDEHNLNDDRLSMWLQLTISKLFLKFNLLELSEKESNIICEIVDITNSLDMHESHTNFKCKINSISVKKSSKQSDIVLLMSEVHLPHHLLFALTSKVASRESVAHTKKSCPLNSNETEFLNFIFTRVYEKSSLDKFVKRYENKKFKSSSQNEIFCCASHLDEICITLQPLILVLDFESILVLIKLFEMMIGISTVFYKGSSCEVGEAEDTFISNELPLVHLHMRGLYVFATTFNSPNLLNEEHYEDTLVIYVDYFEIVPHADNPLPRLVVNKDLYAKVVQLGVFGSLPGYPLENRQYQACIMGLTLASTNWSHIFKCSSVYSKSLLSNDVQNPALEWNFNLRSRDTFHVGLLSSAVSIQIIFAPAVICNENVHSRKLVCGHSMEINAVSELEICLTSSEMRLLVELISKSSDLLLKFRSCFDVQSNELSVTPPAPSNKVPFDLLMTGIRLNIITFMQQNYSHGNVLTNCDESSEFILKPLLCCLISQPYLVIKYDELNIVSKLEVSCYDACVKTGNPLSSCAATNLHSRSPKFCPSHTDFVDFILETKLGKPDAATGVLSSLCTCTISNFHSDTAKIDLKIERPVKISYTKEHHEMIVAFLVELWNLTNKSDNNLANENLRPSCTDEMISSIFNIRTSLKWVEHASLVSGQFVFQWMVRHQEKEATLKFSTKSLNCDISPQTMNKSSCNVKLTNLAFTVSTRGNVFQIFGPIIVESQLILNMFLVSMKPETPNSVTIPSIDIYIHSDMILLQLSKDSINCLNTILSYISSSDSINDFPSGIKRTADWIDKSKIICIDFENDLKSNIFSFLHIDKSIPACGEITFQTGPLNSSMTWKYHEPRAITKLTVVPIPLQIDEEHIQGFNRGSVGFSCILQYSLDDGINFRNYSSFEVGNDTLIEVDLPSINAYNLMVSCMWRALLLQNTGECLSNVYVDSDIKRKKEILSPLVLASCLRINSSIIPNLIPVLTLNASFGKLEAVLKYSRQNNEKSGVQNLDALPNHRIAIMMCTESSIYIQALNNFSTTRFNMISEIECQLINYTSLAWSKVVQGMLVALNLLIDKKESKIEIVCSIDDSHVIISQEIARTLNLLYNLWNDSPDISYIVSCCVVSNKTQMELYFGEVGTEEVLYLPSNYSYQYLGGYLHKELWFGKSPKKSESRLTLDKKCSLKKVYSIDGRTLFACSDGDFKIEIRGNLTLASKLDVGVHIRVEYEGNIRMEKLRPMELLPSFVVIQKQLEKVTIWISVDDSQTWSEEITLGNNSKKHPLKVYTNNRHILIWCEIIIQTVLDVKEYLVLLSPIFVLRSHYPLKLLMNVSSNELDWDFQITVEGKGKKTVLHCLNDFPLFVTFQLNLDMSPSKPVLSISSKMLANVMESGYEADVDIGHIIKDWDNENHFCKDLWPYNSIDESVLSPTQISSVNCSDHVGAITHTPNIELSINLSQYSSYSNTVLVELTPKWIIINETNLDLFISNCATSELWLFSSMQVFVPPMMVQFVIMFMIENLKHTSDIITLLDNELPSPYQPCDDLHLAIESHATLSIPISYDGTILQQIHLTIHSTWRHCMRIITIKERFIFVNNIPYLVQLHGIVCSANQTEVEVDDSTQPTVCANMSINKLEIIQPLLMWNCCGNEASSTFVISMRLSNDKIASNFAWSCPISLEIASETSCHHVVVPYNKASSSDNGLIESIPCCITVRVEKGFVYLVLNSERYAYLRVHNNCNISLYMAVPQSSDVTYGRTISSQAVSIKACSSGYFCPKFNTKSITMFPFTIIIGCTGPTFSILWSLPLEIHENLSSVIKLGNSDIKIELEIKGLISHLNLTHVIRANVLEVKKVICNSSFHLYPKRYPKTLLPQNITDSDHKNEFLCCGFKIKGAILCKSMFWIFQDDNPKNFALDKDVKYGSENILLIAMDDVYFSFKSFWSDKLQDSTYQFEVSIGDLQMDNKAFHDGSFDFPVIMLRSQEEGYYKKYKNVCILYDVFSYPLENVFFKTSTMLIGPTFQILDLILSFTPFSICLEDNFIYQFMEFIYSFKHKLISCQPDLNKISHSFIPADVRLISNDFAHPVRLNKLVIEPLRILISIHASLKLFLALDSTPINFGKFEKVDIYLTKQQLSQLLTIHYASSIILRTGVVIGSLEILGNPTGFVRNISNGVFDMVYLPYNGLMLGPASCVTGFSNGIKSIIKHFSTGTLTSISNFASGISRNMERLSMDEDHINRFERMRRNKPQGLTQGLFDGLAGFGLSLLGAIAGIADQPLQIFMDPKSDDLSLSSKAKGVVSGLGKGLIGMIAKPIGGAAELVSMTSIGIMHGAGLVKVYRQKDYRMLCSNEFQCNFIDQVIFKKRDLLKYQEEELLYCLDVYSMSPSVHCLIILTSSVIHVWNCSEDCLLCSYLISDVYLTVDNVSYEIFIFVFSLEEHHNPYLVEFQGLENDLLVKTDSQRIIDYISRNHLSKGLTFGPSISSTRLKLKYRFKFHDKHKANGLMCLFDYILCNRDVNHFIT